MNTLPLEATMKHTSHADYALRVLLYLRVAPEQRGSVAEIAAAHRISRNHLDKVVQKLAGADIVETTRGRGGGVHLVRDPSTITVGQVMRIMESDFAVVECLGPVRYCRIAGVCGARNVFAQALDAYFEVLDQATLEDIATNDYGLLGALGMTHSGPPVA
ncbi:Rrf2 family transcriptional regulator [Gordonia sp. N1V]|uniref:RrF2 family transcriptional regulator n=1 Tax=Gordonia sp. N1V TaxID=3034163 RepID=UPI0023E14950|nr:Rrf2 family transcriptional regulator [Gordonia sp. N1V]MDF3282458.1 Rrf2 family transcriptional regulator [Gordonia sp. N1V]